MDSTLVSGFWLNRQTPEEWSEITIVEVPAGIEKYKSLLQPNVHYFYGPRYKGTIHNHLVEPSQEPLTFNMTEDFHVYGFEWSPMHLRWYVDGKMVRASRNKHYFQPLQMNINVESNDYFGARPDDARLPAVYEVDWVRTYHLVPDERAMACTGVVTCAETGRTLKDVHVRMLEDDRSILTDVQGQFYLFSTEKGAKTLVFDKPGFVVQEKTVTGVRNNIEVQLTPRKMSAASYRWLDYIESETAYRTLNYRQDRFWKLEFKQTDLGGDFASDPKLIRRDPSAVIKVGDLYYVYYTRGMCYAEGPVKKFFPWDQCDIWYATSTDGWNWQEQGPAVERGPAGSYDDASVFTVEVLAHEGKYYLVYQCVKAPYVYRVKNTVGMAIADSPDGPWTKLPEPILRPTNNGQWQGEEGRAVVKKGDFDSHKVHDPCLMFYKGKFYLYYKGERMGEERFFGQREIKWGVAIADRPEGPYIKSEYNPISNSGHEVCVWHHNGGIASLITTDGPEKNTIQWAPDGINFEIMSTLSNPPTAMGLYRTDHTDKDPLEGIRWGLWHTNETGHWRTSWDYIKRFDIVQNK